MMLPTPDSTGAQNHDRKPNGIPLDSVRPENALVKANKSKEKSLHFLGFLWPNRAFSMGYGESKQKNLFPCHTVAQRSQSRVWLLPRPLGRHVRLHLSNRKRLAHIQFFRKQMCKFPTPVSTLPAPG